jgi:hypothetical protein
MRPQNLTAYLFMVIFFMACSSDKKEGPAISFYYWKTTGRLNTPEQEALRSNEITTLYVRYFDVDFDPATGMTRPLSIIRMDKSFTGVSIVPVIYIKNRVFVNADSARINKLCQEIYAQIGYINETNKKTVSEAQFDCDWTDQTKQAFFRFLEVIKKKSGWTLTATIRLHQVKYKQRTGIPPVDRGVLMFYNMGHIDAGPENSIYTRSNANRYVSSLKTYPLPLDIALPVFSWGIGIRDGKVQYLLNKMYPGDFEKDSNFVKAAPGRYRAVRSFFKSGSYIRQDDVVKVESISGTELMEMANLLRKHLSQPIRKLIFYDLDSANLQQYDEDIFQKVSDRFR